jgi:hypothetical protein
MSNFGALTDHFGLADTNLVLVASSKVPVASRRADAQDENGDIAASAFYGNSAGELFEVSNTYALKSGSLDTGSLQIGEVSSGLVATTGEITTDNGSWPQITLSGTLGAEDVCAVSGYENTFSFPSYTILGCKRAQPMGFTVTGGRLTGCILSGSIELAQQENGLGEPVAHGVSGGTVEVSADFVRTSTAPAWTVGAGLTETQAPGADEGQAAFHTASATAAGTLSRDVTGS